MRAGGGTCAPLVGAASAPVQGAPQSHTHCLDELQLTVLPWFVLKTSEEPELVLRKEHPEG